MTDEIERNLDGYVRGKAEIEAALVEIHRSAPHYPSVAHLARHSALSSGRFEKSFAHYLGEPPGAYMKRVRLEYAVGLMRSGPALSLTEVALASGYSELSAFSRAFANHFGIAPSRWDRRAPLNRGGIGQAGSASGDYKHSGRTKKEIGDAGAQIHMRDLEPLRLACIRVPQAYKGNRLQDAFDFLESWARGAGLWRGGKGIVGMSYDDTFATSGDKIGFVLGYPVAGDVELGDRPFLFATDAPVQAATLHCAGGIADFMAAWDRLERQWLPGSGYIRAAMPAFEIYRRDPRKDGMRHWDMDCVMPVAPIAPVMGGE